MEAEAEADAEAEAKAKVKPSAVEATVAVHWLTRVAERSGLAGERPPVPPEAEAKEAWRAVTRIHKIKDPRLCELVVAYFRLDVADFTARDPKAPRLSPLPPLRDGSAPSRRHL